MYRALTKLGILVKGVERCKINKHKMIVYMYPIEYLLNTMNIMIFCSMVVKYSVFFILEITNSNLTISIILK